MQPFAKRRQEIVLRRTEPHRRRPHPERRSQAPLVVIVPGPPVRRTERHGAVQVADRAFKPDRRRVVAANRGKSEFFMRSETTQGAASPATRSAR